VASGWLESRGLGTRVVGVDGHSGAGKSTFAEALARRVGAALVRGDDFYRVMDDGERAGLSPAEGVERYYDWQRLRDQVLTVVRAGATARYRPYDWHTGHLAAHYVTVQAAAIVVDGLFVSRRELRAFVDHAILIDSPAIVRRRRQIDRADASNEWLERWDAAERYFFEQIRPPATFDMVVRDPSTCRTRTSDPTSRSSFSSSPDPGEADAD
jgi:uridine kinase